MCMCDEINTLQSIKIVRMGGFEKWRNFLLNLCPSSFQDHLAEGTEFCLCLVDLMMVLAPSVLMRKSVDGQTGFETESITRRIDQTVRYYQNNEEDPRRPLIKTGLIVMLDTIHRVPKNKSTKQKSRDGEEAKYMNEALYNEMSNLMMAGEEGRKKESLRMEDSGILSQYERVVVTSDPPSSIVIKPGVYHFLENLGTETVKLHTTYSPPE